jgi:hypothetical protein
MNLGVPRTHAVWVAWAQKYLADCEFRTRVVLIQNSNSEFRMGESHEPNVLIYHFVVHSDALFLCAICSSLLQNIDLLKSSPYYYLGKYEVLEWRLI